MKKAFAILLSLSLLLCGLSSCNTPSVQDDSTTASSVTSYEPTTADTTASSVPSDEPTTADTTEAVPPSETTAQQQLEYNVYDIASNKDKIRIQGRSTDTSNGVSVDWSASGIEFYATYSDSIAVLGSATKNVKFRVYVDGTETGMITIGTSASVKKLPGTNVDEPTTSHIRLVRVEYVKDGLATLKTIRLAGTIHEWQEERKFIEYIGDSITCGYGSISSNDAKDGSRTFAYLSACELGVDYSMVAISGIGVCKSTGQHSGKTMTDLYKYNTWYRSQTDLYAPERKADLIVVNLNTNDHNLGATEAAYKANLKSLISDIRSIHGEDVSIVWITGQMVDYDSAVNGWLADVFEELGGEANGLYILKTTKNNQGGNGHPNYASHKTTAKHLVTFINSKNLLG